MRKQGRGSNGWLICRVASPREHPALELQNCNWAPGLAGRPFDKSENGNGAQVGVKPKRNQWVDAIRHTVPGSPREQIPEYEDPNLRGICRETDW